MPTITAATDDNDTSPTVYFVISARTHELGDTIGVATRRTFYNYYLTSTDLGILASSLVNMASSGATASAIVTTVAVVPDTTVEYRKGWLITNSTGGAVIRFGVTAGTTCALVLITPDNLLAASTGVVATTT